MAYDFPSSPTTGQVVTFGQQIWQFNGVAWVPQSGGIAVTLASDTPPASPGNGQMWFESDTGVLSINYDSTWLQINGVTGLSDGPLDGSIYGRMSGTWVKTPPLPTAVAGLGQFTQLLSSSGGALTLPAGGTWAYWFYGYTTASSTIWLHTQAGVAAGGTQVRAAQAGVTFAGFCWRIA